MAIRSINGTILGRNGQIAGSQDCCCTPPCLPNPCVAPGINNCKYCYDVNCNGGSCLEWASISVDISGVGDVVSVPAVFANAPVCADGWDCHCEVFNSTFIHDFSTSCRTTWKLREPNPPFLTFDVCNPYGNLQLLCFWRIFRQVSVAVAVANEEVIYTTGVKTSLVFPNEYPFTSRSPNDIYVCNNYTLSPGHYVMVDITMDAYGGGPGVYFGNFKRFIYSFGNGIKVDSNCAEDQYYPACGPYTGGTATLLVSSRYSTQGGSTPRVYIADCGDYDELCQLSNAVVTVNAPVVEACPEVEEPLP